MTDTEVRTEMSVLHLDRNDSAYLKGWAMLFMLIHHLFSEDVLPFMSPIAPQLCTVIGRFCQVCVAMFVFAAGFGMFRAGDKPLRTLRRIPRLYLKLWTVMLLVTIPVMLLTGNFRFDLWELIKNALAVNTTYNTAWWFVFLYAKLMLMNAVFLLLPDNGKGTTHIALLTACATVSILTYVLTPFTGGLIYLAFSQLSEACFYFTILLLGRYAAQHEVLEKLLTILTRRGKLRTCIRAALLLAGALLIWLLLFLIGIDRLFINWFTVPLTVTAVLLLRFAVPADGIRRAVVWYGQVSVWTWLIHMTFITYLPGVTFLLRFPVPTLLWLMLLDLIPVFLLSLLFSLPGRIGHKTENPHV